MDLLTALPDFISSGAVHVLATSGESGANNFLDSTLGTWVKALAGAAGLLVAIFGVLKAIGAFLGGKMGAGIRVIIGTVVLAGILFKLDLLIDFAGWLGDIIGDAISSGEGLA